MKKIKLILILFSIFLVSCAYTKYSSVALLAPGLSSGSSSKTKPVVKSGYVSTKNVACTNQQRKNWKFQTNKAKQYCWSETLEEIDFNSQEGKETFKCIGFNSHTIDKPSILDGQLKYFTGSAGNSYFNGCEFEEITYPKKLPQGHKVGILYVCKSPESKAQKEQLTNYELPKEFHVNTNSYLCQNEHLTWCCIP
jgi:hypothetical protein